MNKQNFRKVYPIGYTQGISDGNTGESLDNIIKNINHIFINYDKNITTTRLKVPISKRRKGLWISYIKDDKQVNEQYVGANADNITDENWSNNDNWNPVPDLAYITEHGVPAKLVDSDTISYDNLNSQVNVKDRSITGGKIADGAITTNKIAENAITGNKIAQHTIVSENIENGAITNGKYAEKSIDSTKLSDDVNAQIAKGNVTSTDDIKVNDDRSLQLADRAVDASKFINRGYKILRPNPQQVNRYNLKITGKATKDGNITVNGTPVAVTTAMDTNAIEKAIQATQTDVDWDDTKGVTDFNTSPTVDYGETGITGRIDTVQKTINLITQDIINEPNTTYIINYDFDLNGGTINIPTGCTLDFQGGSFSNGTIISNNTEIKSNLQFCLDVVIQNSLRNQVGYSEWFNKGEEDWAVSINKVLTYFSECRLCKSKYTISSTIKLPFNKKISGIHSRQSFIELDPNISNYINCIITIDDDVNKPWDSNTEISKLAITCNTSNNKWLGILSNAYSLILKHVWIFQISNPINISGSYIDNVTLNNITIGYCKSYNNKCFNISPGIGDCYSISNLHMHSCDKFEISNIDDSAFNSNIINCPIYINNCNGVTFAGLHQEALGDENTNLINIQDSDVVLDNYIGWKGIKENIKITRDQIKSFSNVIIRNSFIKTYYSNNQITTFTSDTDNIDIESNCVLELKGFHRLIFLTKNQAAKYPITIKNFNEFNNYNYIYSDNSFISNYKTIYSNAVVTKSDPLPLNENRIIATKCLNDEYTKNMYYSIIQIADIGRKLKFKDELKKMVKLSSTNAVAQLGYGSVYGKFLIRKGESSNNYTKYTYLDLCSDEYTYDTGYTFGTSVYKDYTEDIDIDNWDFVNKLIKNNNTNVTIYTDSIPINKTFVENDILICNGIKYIYHNNNWIIPAQGLLSNNTTANRPTNPTTGQMFFDTTLSKCIVYNGTAWVNVDGSTLTANSSDTPQS